MAHHPKPSRGWCSIRIFCGFSLSISSPDNSGITRRYAFTQQSAVISIAAERMHVILRSQDLYSSNEVVERRDPMKFKHLLPALLFILVSVAWGQEAPSQAPAPPS